MLRAWAAAAAMLASALALGAPALAEAPASAPARVAQALRGDGRTARALREEAEVTRLVAGVDLVGDGLHPLFRANRGERGPCPPHGVYSGSGANFSALGFCCDADLCSSCGGPTCADLGTKISYVPKGTRRQENHCCKGWLAKNHKRIQECGPSGRVPCFFSAAKALPVRDEDVAQGALVNNRADGLFAPRGEPEYERCAVVGSSPSLANVELGAEIDSYDAIMRFNLAPTEGFERQVGSRTDVLLVNDVVARDVDAWGPRCAQHKQLHLLYGFIRDEWRSIGAGVREELGKHAGACDHATLVEEIAWKEMYQEPYAKICRGWARMHSVENIRCRRPSMGTCGIMLATIGGLCRHTTLYGWGNIQQVNVPGHYWDHDHRHSTGAHSYGIEAATAVYIAEMFNHTNANGGLNGHRTVRLRPI